jgi:hypothetical protein
LNNSRPKAKDQSSNKFLQRIAGKKAIGPPPTPRPIIGEHPVRILLRENADNIEELKSETPLQREAPGASIGKPLIPQQTGHAPHIDEEPNASSGSTIGHRKSVAGEVVGKKVGKAPASLVEPEQKLRAGSPEELNASKGSKGAGVVKIRTGLSGSVPGLGRAEEAIIEIRKKYRLNNGEFYLYRALYLMTHAVGKTECSFVVSELVKSTGMLERRIRDNLRRLKKQGWVVLLAGYDFENQEKAKYRVNTRPRLS